MVMLDALVAINIAIGFGLLGYAYYQGHRGGKGLAPKLLGLGAAMLAYTWLLHQEGDAWTWIKLYVHLSILALWLLAKIPAIGARFAAIGLSLSAPDRDPPDGRRGRLDRRRGRHVRRRCRGRHPPGAARRRCAQAAGRGMSAS